jgi:hypothetical protein
MQPVQHSDPVICLPETNSHLSLSHLFFPEQDSQNRRGTEDLVWESGLRFWAIENGIFYPGEYEWDSESSWAIQVSITSINIGKYFDVHVLISSGVYCFVYIFQCT